MGKLIFVWGEGMGKLIQPVLDLVEAGNGAGFVLVTARCAADGDAADRVLPGTPPCPVRHGLPQRNS
jgi:hypothetical protein